MLANSNHSNCGATSVDLESCFETVSAPGSPKTRAPSAEASTTLTGISILSYHRAGFCRRAQPKGTHPGQELGRGQGAFFAGGRLNDCHQLTLKRTMISRRFFAQLLGDFVRNVLWKDLPAPVSPS
jgi:hypothetical protein